MDSITLSAEPRAFGKSDLQVWPMAWIMWRFAGVDGAAARLRVEAA